MLQLPTTITRYFEATNAHNVVQMAACFAKDATVHDVGENLDIKGIAAIQKWIEKITKEYKLQAKPLEVSVKGEDIEVVTEVSGSFDGSPLQFRYEFKLKNDMIIFLSTKPK